MKSLMKCANIMFLDVIIYLLSKSFGSRCSLSHYHAWDIELIYIKKHFQKKSQQFQIIHQNNLNFVGKSIESISKILFACDSWDFFVGFCWAKFLNDPPGGYIIGQ